MPQALEIENLIRHLAVLARNVDALSGPRPSRPGWWVLVLGEDLDPDDLDRRDAARERLRMRAEACGVSPRELVWVWDETDRVQLVAGRYGTRTEAEEHARGLRSLGLDIRVTEAFTDT
ncbi:hypothetical protein [Desulfocurvus sp. DL9XJH121]